MFIKTMAGPADDRDEVLVNPDWNEIEDAIHLLDGRACTLLTLETGKGEAHMAIGGGGDGLYVSYLTFDNQTFYNLVTRDAPEQKRLLVVGAQAGEYPARQCVDLETIIRAARKYYQTGERDPDSIWDVDPAQ